jgi:intergrase/recombinase
VLLDSGLRIVEAVALVNGFKMENVQEVNGFYRYELAMFRGTKQAYYGHFSKHTLEELQQIREPIKERAASRILGKHDLIRPKYLRKYAFDKMIELDVPESVADFIEGRVPVSVGAKHYMALARQSAKFYPRYLRHLEKLRRINT